MAPLDGLDEHRLARLIDAGRGLLSELDLETVLDRLLQTAADLTGARYVALGVLDEGRRELARFLTRGIDEDTHRAIGDLPRGRGLLGVLIDDPRPLRLRRRRRPSALLRLPARAPADALLPRRPDPHPRRGVGEPLSDREGRRRAVRAPTTRRPSSSSPTGRRSRSRTRASIATWPPAARSSSAPCAGCRPPPPSPAPSAARPSSTASSSSWSSAGGR